MSDYIYKAKFRFPTEQFAYIEIEAEGSAESLKSQYNAFERLLKVGVGLDTKEWNKVLDVYRSGHGMSEEVMGRMNKAQQWLIHELDKSDMRIN